jgi:superfamily II DNA or RNA helicase
MSFNVGSLVNVRGRDWIVLPETSDKLLMVKPLGATDDEITGILPELEKVTPASFDLPTPELLGDFRSCSLLRDALRLGFRSSAGPFRSFGRIAVEPRPYQLVPMMMALRLDPIRMLIADDVGIGKTIESCLIVRELLDRGECTRLTVLCPPHLAEQWQEELNEKFHIDAELVLAGTVRRLEKRCGINQSIFEIFPYTVVSIDYIKADRRRDEFLRTAPELVIVDEAHSASFDDARSSSRHQRHELVKKLSQDPGRHLILVTATPHSGKEAAFRSLLGFIIPDFLNLPDDLSGSESQKYRRKIASHFIQRRRADIRHFLDEETEFPEMEAKEEHYTLSTEYKALFDKALNYAREIVRDKNGGQRHQRVRWWSALALLRSLASSPAAAAATLRNRSATLDTETVEEANEIGRRQVFDLQDIDSIDAADVIPGSDSIREEESEKEISRRRLLSMAREADRLCGDLDNKMLTIVQHLKTLIRDGFRPIVFCRFIQTAEYLAEQLRQRLPSKVCVTPVTGLLPPKDRELRVAALAKSDPRVLVCTDCLSEGINLQDHFDAVIHYDLSWNPTRHEQREGRVDRFGQPRPKVRMLTYYGKDNQIDGVVLDVLLRKHKQIKSSLGISVPVPADTEVVVEAIFEGLLLREQSGRDTQTLLPGLDEFFREDKKRLHREWDQITEREKRSRTMFAQDAMSARVEDVQRELQAVRSAIGSPVQVEQFVTQALSGYGAHIKNKDGKNVVDCSAVPRSVREACGYQPEIFTARFGLPVEDGELYLCRTHPLVEGLSDYVLNTALDTESTDSLARRCGVVRTKAVQRRTTLLLLRHRFHLVTTVDGRESRALAEDTQIAGFLGSPDKTEWLEEKSLVGILDARPDSNVLPEQARDEINRIVEGFNMLRPQLDIYADERAKELQESHLRVRDAALLRRSQKLEIKPELPPDVLGIYVYLPAGGI